MGWSHSGIPDNQLRATFAQIQGSFVQGHHYLGAIRCLSSSHPQMMLILHFLHPSQHFPSKVGHLGLKKARGVQGVIFRQGSTKLCFPVVCGASVAEMAGSFIVRIISVHLVFSGPGWKVSRFEASRTGVMQRWQLSPVVRGNLVRGEQKAFFMTKYNLEARNIRTE